MQILKIIIFHLLLLAIDEAVAQKDISSTHTVKILLVGNSLSYTNNLPELLLHEGVSKNVQLAVDLLAKPNYSLEDHWNEAKLQKLIASGEYNYVVVQQGPSSQADGLKMLLNYGRKIVKLCERKGVQLVFLMVWPSLNNYHTFDGVINNYTVAAKETNAILCPVGKEWKAHFDATNDFSFLGPDGFYPSAKGTQSIAQIMMKALRVSD